VDMTTSSPTGAGGAEDDGAARRRGLSRRQFLAGTAGAGAVAACAAGLAAPPALASVSGRGGVPRAGMPSLAEVWGWEEQLVGFGTRYTGSGGHAAFVGWLAERLSAVPGFRLRTDRLAFNRWLARDFALRVDVPAAVGRSGPVPVTYYFPRGSPFNRSNIA
jgi:hypothetical protein